MLSRQFWTILISSLLFAFVSNAQCVEFEGLTNIGNLPLSVNALTNSSFENSPLGQRSQGGFTQDNAWNYFGGGNIFVDPSNEPNAFPCGAVFGNPIEARTGNRQLKMFGQFPGDASTNVSGGFTDFVSVAGGQNYVGGIYALSPTAADCADDNLKGDNEVVVSLEFVDAAGNCMNVISGRFGAADATGQWIRYEAYAQAPPSAVQARINVLFIQQANAGGAVYLDDAFLHQVQTPTAPTMGEWGIMILGLLILIIGIVAIKQTSFSLTKTAA